MSRQQKTPRTRTADAAPRVPTKKHQLAEWLTQLSCGRLEVEYRPNAYWVADSRSNRRPGGKGHLFDVGIAGQLDDDGPIDAQMGFDDRDGPAPQLLIKELRRVGKIHLDLARQMQAAIKSGKPLPESGWYVSLVVVRRPDGWESSDLHDVPAAISPVAIHSTGLTQDDAKSSETRFNFPSERKGGKLWLVSMPDAEARALKLPAWNDVKAAADVDYEDEDLIDIGYYGRDPAHVAEMLRIARSDTSGAKICGLPASLYNECFIRLKDEMGLSSTVAPEIRCSDVDLATATLTITVEARSQGRPEKRLPLTPEIVDALRRFIAAGKREMLFPLYQFGDILSGHTAIYKKAKDAIERKAKKQTARAAAGSRRGKRLAG